MTNIDEMVNRKVLLADSEWLCVFRVACPLLPDPVRFVRHEDAVPGLEGAVQRNLLNSGLAALTPDCLLFSVL